MHKYKYIFSKNNKASCVFIRDGLFLENNLIIYLVGLHRCLYQNFQCKMCHYTHKFFKFADNNKPCLLRKSAFFGTQKPKIWENKIEHIENLFNKFQEI